MSSRKKLGVPDHEHRAAERPAASTVPPHSRHIPPHTLGTPSSEGLVLIDVPDDQRLFNLSEEVPPPGRVAQGQLDARQNPTVHRSVIALLVVVSGLLVLLVASQLALALSVLTTLPAPFRWLGWTAVMAALLAVLLAAAYLIRQYFELRQSPNISLVALAVLHDRACTRAAAQAETTSALRLLKRFLDEFPLHDDNLCQLGHLGFERHELSRLVNQHKLLTQNAKGSDTMWLRDVDQRFLSILDEVADRHTGIMRVTLASRPQLRQLSSSILASH